jgi:inner membrane protein
MLIAHLPAGCIVATAACRRATSPAVMAAALIGSVAPDFDMIYFYASGGRVHHHAYVTHWPLFWLASALLILPLLKWLHPASLFAGCVFFTAAILHMVLDTIAAPLLWLAPFSFHEFEMVRVPATHANWIASFMLHWTFLLEISICLSALVLFLMRRRRAGRSAV